MNKQFTSTSTERKQMEEKRDETPETPTGLKSEKPSGSKRVQRKTPIDQIALKLLEMKSKQLETSSCSSKIQEESELEQKRKFSQQDERSETVAVLKTEQPCSSSIEKRPYIDLNESKLPVKKRKSSLFNIMPETYTVLKNEQPCSSKDEEEEEDDDLDVDEIALKLFENKNKFTHHPEELTGLKTEQSSDSKLIEKKKESSHQDKKAHFSSKTKKEKTDFDKKSHEKKRKGKLDAEPSTSKTKQEKPDSDKMKSHEKKRKGKLEAEQSSSKTKQSKDVNPIPSKFPETKRKSSRQDETPAEQSSSSKTKEEKHQIASKPSEKKKKSSRHDTKSDILAVLKSFEGTKNEKRRKSSGHHEKSETSTMKTEASTSSKIQEENVDVTSSKPHEKKKKSKRRDEKSHKRSDSKSGHKRSDPKTEQKCSDLQSENRSDMMLLSNDHEVSPAIQESTSKCRERYKDCKKSERHKVLKSELPSGSKISEEKLDIDVSKPHKKGKKSKQHDKESEKPETKSSGKRKKSSRHDKKSSKASDKTSRKESGEKEVHHFKEPEKPSVLKYKLFTGYKTTKENPDYGKQQEKKEFSTIVLPSCSQTKEQKSKEILRPSCAQTEQESSDIEVEEEERPVLIMERPSRAQTEEENSDIEMEEHDIKPEVLKTEDEETGDTPNPSKSNEKKRKADQDDVKEESDNAPSGSKFDRPSTSRNEDVNPDLKRPKQELRRELPGTSGDNQVSTHFIDVGDGTFTVLQTGPPIGPLNSLSYGILINPPRRLLHPGCLYTTPLCIPPCSASTVPSWEHRCRYQPRPDGGHIIPNQDLLDRFYRELGRNPSRNELNMISTPSTSRQPVPQTPREDVAENVNVAVEDVNVDVEEDVNVDVEEDVNVEVEEYINVEDVNIDVEDINVDTDQDDNDESSGSNEEDSKDSEEPKFKPSKVFSPSDEETNQEFPQRRQVSNENLDQNPEEQLASTSGTYQGDDLACHESVYVSSDDEDKPRYIIKVKPTSSLQ